MTQKQISIYGRIVTSLIICSGAILILGQYLIIPDRDILLSTFWLSFVVLSYGYLKVYDFYYFYRILGFLRIFEAILLTALIIASTLSIYNDQNLTWILFLIIDVTISLYIYYKYKNKLINKFHIYPRFICIIVILVAHMIDMGHLSSYSIFYIFICEYILFHKLKDLKLESPQNDNFVDLLE